MNLELIIRPEAEADIAEAFDWYEAQVIGLGSEFLLILDALFNSIIRNHNLYPKVYKNVHRALTRRFPYAVFYIVQETKIVVLSVSHLKRNPRIWMGRV